MSKKETIMANNVIIGVDFLTNEICNLFGIKTDSTCEIHRKLWYMFYSIQNRPSIDGLMDKDICNPLNVKFEEKIKLRLIRSILLEQILDFISSYIKLKGISHEVARKMVRNKLYEHKEIQLGEFM